MTERLQQSNDVHLITVIIVEIIFAIPSRSDRARSGRGTLLLQRIIVAVIIVKAVFLALVYNVHIHIRVVDIRRRMMKIFSRINHEAAHQKNGYGSQKSNMRIAREKPDTQRVTTIILYKEYTRHTRLSHKYLKLFLNFRFFFMSRWCDTEYVIINFDSFLSLSSSFLKIP